MGCGLCRYSKKQELEIEQIFENFYYPKIKEQSKKIESVPTLYSMVPNGIEENLSNYIGTANEMNSVYDYDEHSRKIFRLINKLRAKPQKYISKIFSLIKSIDKENNSIDIVLENVKVFLPQNINPLDAIAFLQTASPQTPILWSNLVYTQANEHLTSLIDKINHGDVEISIKPNLRSENKEVVKILADFIVKPKTTVLLMFLISQENRKIMFSSDIYEAAVVTMPRNLVEYFTNQGCTLLYFLRPSKETN